MASRFTQYGGELGAESALRELIANQMAARAYAEKVSQERHKLAQGDMGLQLEGGRLGLEGEKQQEAVRQFDAGADQRQAQTGYLRTQMADLQGKPTREADSRAHDAMMQEARQSDDLAKIQATGNQQARVAGIRTAGGGSGDDLATFEAKEQIKAKYGGARPSLGAERQALSFFNRAKQASDDIGTMESDIAQMGLPGQARLEYAPNFLQSTDNQKYRQAQRAFTEARLRKESGAAIPTAEYENDARTYFAQPGDGPDVMAQKVEARKRVLEGLQFAAGKAFEEFYGEPNKPREQSAPASSSGGVKIKSLRQVR